MAKKKKGIKTESKSRLSAEGPRGGSRGGAGGPRPPPSQSATVVDHPTACDPLEAVDCRWDEGDYSLGRDGSGDQVRWGLSLHSQLPGRVGAYLPGAPGKYVLAGLAGASASDRVRARRHLLCLRRIEFLHLNCVALTPRTLNWDGVVHCQCVLPLQRTQRWIIRPRVSASPL